MQLFRSHSPSLAKTMLAAPSEPVVPSPALEAMGKAALAFVQRFDMRRVLGDFEKELIALAAERKPREQADEEGHDRTAVAAGKGR